MAAIAHLHLVAAPGKRLGQRDKGSFGAAERRRLGHCPVKGNAVIGHYHAHHQSRTTDGASTPAADRPPLSFP